MGAEWCILEARSAAPRLCHPGEGAVPLGVSATFPGEHALLLRSQQRLGSRCPHLLHSPSPIFHLFGWLVGAEALSSPRPGKGRRNDKKADNPNPQAQGTDGTMRIVVWEGSLEKKTPEPGWGGAEARPHSYP